MEENLNKRLKINKIVIVILLLILLVALIIILIQCFSAKNFQSNNYSNMGMLITGDDYTFYYKYNSGLIKIKDKEEYQISSDQAYSINYDNGFVYYATPNSGGGIDIKKLSQNGDTNEILTSVISESTKVFLVNGYLYFTTSDTGTISKIDINGKNQSVVLTRTISDFNIVDDTIYFVDDMEFLYQIDINGDNYKAIKEEKTAKKFQILDDDIYYYDNDNSKLMKIETKSKETTEVTDKLNCDIYNVTSNGIFFLDSINKKICKVNLNGEKETDIVTINVDNTKINVYGNNLYYLDIDDEGSYRTKRIQTNGKELSEIKY